MLCFTCKASSQDVLEAILYGGVNFSNLHTKYNEYDNALGGQGGFLTKVGSRFVQVELGLEYSYKGYKYKNETQVGSEGGADSNYSFVVETRISSMSHHITIPIAIAIGKWSDEGNGGISFSGGGYADIGIYGRNVAKEKTLYYDANALYGVDDEVKYKTDLYGDMNHQIKRIDAGWQLGCLIGMGPVLRIGATYRRGLVNVSNISGYKQYNKSFMINLLFCVHYED